MSYLDNQNIYYVYQLRLETSDLPFYIGKGKGNRINEHFKPSQLSISSFKNRIIKKAMSDDVKILREKIHENLNEMEAFDLEISYITMYGRKTRNGDGILANGTDGGEGTTNPDESTRIAMSNAHKLRSPKDEQERILKILESRNNRSEEEKQITRQKYSLTRRSLNTQPWETGKCTEYHIETIWARADILYELRLQGYGKRKLGKLFNCKVSMFGNILKKFDSGWNPLEDMVWLKRFKSVV